MMSAMAMTKEELRDFCETGAFAHFQKKLNQAAEPDGFDVLFYLLADGANRLRTPRLVKSGR